MKKTITMFLATVLVTIMVTSCANPTVSQQPSSSGGPSSSTIASSSDEVINDGKPLALTFQHFAGAEGGYADAIKQACTLFTQKYPNVTFDIKFVAWMDTAPTIKQGIAAGAPPDIVHMRTSRIPELVEDGAFEEIPEAWVSDMKPGTVDTMKYSDGKLYGIPVTMGATGLFYNKTLLTKLGIDISTITTMDAYIAACQKVKDAGIKAMGSWYADGQANYEIQDLIYAYIQPKIDSKFAENLMAGVKKFNDYPEFISAMNTRMKLFDDFILTSPADQSMTLAGLYKDFASGKIAFFHCNNACADGIYQAQKATGNTDELRFTAFPEVGSKNWNSMVFLDFSLMVPKGPNSEAAKIFLKFCTQPEINKIFAEKSGNVSTCNSVTIDNATQLLKDAEKVASDWGYFFETPKLLTGQFETELSRIFPQGIASKWTAQEIADELQSAYDNIIKTS